MDFTGAWMRRIITAAALWLSWSLTGPLYGAAGTPGMVVPCTQPEVISAFPLGGTPRYTWVAPALLANFYEHGREHAPPRQPGGVMQRREAYYRAPPEPFRLLRSQIGESGADRQLRSVLALVELSWLQGREISLDDIRLLRPAAIASSLPADSLLEAARGIQWLVGESVAEPLFAAGLEKASQLPGPIRPGEPRSLWLLHTIDQSACVWRANDPDSIVARFSIARRLTPRLSVESRRAGYLLAEGLLAAERRDEAAELILKVQREHAEVGDLGRLEPPDVPEMDFVIGFILFNARRYEEAIPPLARVYGEHFDQSNTLLFESYLRTARFEEARSMIVDTSQNSLDLRHPEPSLARLNEVLSRARWAAEVGPLEPPSLTPKENR